MGADMPVAMNRAPEAGMTDAGKHHSLLAASKPGDMLLHPAFRRARLLLDPIVRQCGDERRKRLFADFAVVKIVGHHIIST
jgi:hypothetical protein